MYPSDLFWGNHIVTILLPLKSVSAAVQFADGVYLVLLMGLLEGYFVPLYNFFLTPENFDQKVRSRLRVKSHKSRLHSRNGRQVVFLFSHKKLVTLILRQ